jgi:hypothetical protein
LDPDKRSLFLEEVCEGDTDLKKEVEDLLSLDNHPDSSIERSPGGLALDMLAERSYLPQRFKALTELLLDPSTAAGVTDRYVPLLKNYRDFADAFC